MDRRGDLSSQNPEARPMPPAVVRETSMDGLQRQPEDIVDMDGPPDDPTLPGKMSDTLKRVEIPPDV